MAKNKTIKRMKKGFNYMMGRGNNIAKKYSKTRDTIAKSIRKFSNAAEKYSSRDGKRAKDTYGWDLRENKNPLDIDI